MGSLSNLKINDCSSSGVIASFGIGTGVVGGSGGKGTDIITNIGVITLMGGKYMSSPFLRNLMLLLFLERGIHPSMTCFTASVRSISDC